MIFLEKEENGFKFWELQVDRKIPCTEKEKKIYGVEFKTDIDAKNPYVFEMDFADEGKFYQVRTGGWNVFQNPYFKDLEKAKEFLIEQFKDK